ncbi:hypothetical protein PR048_022546 [Dryococelus australis]|uniref:Ankyrin repeat domain-containing protein n=1 Tax=Dryococelus australis TaxID=614101 RepID=A0ABQ9H1E3_9NEOP|nr:hypothetical protein PR048_022546 [Dryococelus australis]
MEYVWFQVLEFKSTKDWRTLRSSLLSLLPNNSAVYRQLETRSTADHLYTWHVGVCGYTQLMSLFLCSGLDVNRQGDYIGNEWLIGASGRGLVNTMKMLLSQGADINTHDFTGFTPLMIAASTDKIDIVKMLVEAGANTTLRNYIGENALEGAQALKNAEVVEYLEQFPH